MTVKISTGTTYQWGGVRPAATPEDTPDQLPAIEESGRQAGNQGNFQQAEQFFRRALALRTRMFGPEAPELIPALNKLGLLFFKTNRPAQAEATFRRALSLSAGAPPALGDEAAMAHGLFGGFLVEAGRIDEGAPLLKQAIAAWTTTPPEDVTRLAVALDSYARVLTKQQKLQQAEMFQRLAVKLFEQAEGRSDRVAASLSNLGSLLALMGREDEALAALETSQEMFAAVAGPSHWYTRNVAEIAEACRKQKEARARPH